MIRVERVRAVPKSVHRESDPSRDSSPYQQILAIRHEVFVEEQQVSTELEFDGLDDGAEHFLARQVRDGRAEPIGAARMRLLGSGQAKAERVCVRIAVRGSGAGKALMQSLEARAQALGHDMMTLHAQVAVIPFYEKLGYRAEGAIFDEAGIDHRTMSKELGSRGD